MFGDSDIQAAMVGPRVGERGAPRRCAHRGAHSVHEVLVAYERRHTSLGSAYCCLRRAAHQCKISSNLTKKHAGSFCQSSRGLRFPSFNSVLASFRDSGRLLQGRASGRPPRPTKRPFTPPCSGRGPQEPRSRPSRPSTWTPSTWTRRPTPRRPDASAYEHRADLSSPFLFVETCFSGVESLNILEIWTLADVRRQTLVDRSVVPGCCVDLKMLKPWDPKAACGRGLRFVRDSLL
jgi:hypothetical protein